MRTTAILAGAVLASGAAAQVAERAVDPESGHTYVRSEQPLTVYDAEALARALGGTLVAIGSQAEETFLLENFGGSEGYWIGLEYPREQWVTGENAEFTHWATGEPDGGGSEPFTLLNWGEPGAWVDASGDSETQRFRALIELAKGVTPGTPPATLGVSIARRGVLLCAIQDLTAKDLESSRHPNLNALWKRSAWSSDAGADSSGDPLAGLGMVVWSVGSAKSRLTSADTSRVVRSGNENLLSRIERVRPEVTTVVLFDDSSLTGLLMDGRVDVRVSTASRRKGGSQAPLADALARATPLCIVAAWTNMRTPGDEEPSASSRAKDLAAIDAELGTLLSAVQARPGYASEEWWIAVAGLTPGKPPRAGDLRARTAVPVCLVAPGTAPREWLGELALVDLAPSALAHLGIEARRSWQLDGRALALDVRARFGENLIVNGGAEAQFGWSTGPASLITGWRMLAPFRVARHAADAAKELGLSYFQDDAEGLARIEQSIDLGAFASDIDRGAVRFRLAGWLGTRGKFEASIECAVEFLGETGRTLERAVLGPVGQAERRGAGAEKSDASESPSAREVAGRVPRRARAARIVLSASGPSGVGQTMADDLSLILERE